MSDTTSPPTDVTIVSPAPSSLDDLVQNLAPFAEPAYADMQPPFPTVWPPPPPLPTVQLPYAGMIPWRHWIEVMAVRPYPTDPPPCPVVVSRYPGLTLY